MFLTTSSHRTGWVTQTGVDTHPDLQHFIGASGSNAVARLLQGISPKHCTLSACRAEGVGEMSFSFRCIIAASRRWRGAVGLLHRSRMTASAAVWRRLGAGYVLQQDNVFPAR